MNASNRSVSRIFAICSHTSSLRSWARRAIEAQHYYDSMTGTIYEFNVTPWSQISPSHLLDKINRKMLQAVKQDLSP